MGSLVHHISQITDARYGVNVLEDSPPGGVQGVGTNIVATVANLPWGPVDEVVELTSLGEFFDTFCPLAFGVHDSYPAAKAYINKTFPNVFKVARISPTGQAVAAKTYQDSTPVNSVTVTAKCPGVVGNSITVAWSANAEDATARDATVAIGTAYSVLYKNVAKIVSAALVVTDPGDPYVTFSKHASGVAVPAVAAASALTGGADGTAAAGDYTTCLDLYASASVAWDVGFVAEPEASLIDAINTACESLVVTHKRGIWVLATPDGQSYSAAKTYVADYRDDRLFYPWPRVNTPNAFDTDREETEVNGNSFAAVAIATVAPEESPGGAPGSEALTGITSLETEATIIQLNDLNASGISPFFMSEAFDNGAILHNAVTTSLTSGKTKVFRRRMTDYVVKSVANFLERFTGRKLDINLSRRILGPVTGPESGQVRQFLQELQDKNRIREWALDEFSGNTQTNINNGVWILLLTVGLYSVQEKIVLRALIGETVTVELA